MSIHEIVLPETKPETEWVRGRALQKVSPTYDHAALQAELVIALRTWAGAGEHGRVGTEWRFRIAPPAAVVRPLVPDVAFLSYDRSGFSKAVFEKSRRRPIVIPVVMEV